MKLLFDQNLSRKLPAKLSDLFPGSAHVFLLGKHRDEDWEIWNFAANEGLVIASKDTDFRQLSFLRGHPPKVIAVDAGNCSTGVVEGLIRARFDDIIKFGTDAVASILSLKPA